MTLEEQQNTLDAAILAAEDAVTRLYELRRQLEFIASPGRVYTRVSDLLSTAQRHVAILMANEVAKNE